jgi:hypothetical protein
MSVASKNYCARVAVMVRRQGEGFVVWGGKASRVGEGRCLFSGDFPKSVIVNVEISAPWKFEETSCEISFCLEHLSVGCPDDGASCRLQAKVVRAPRWVPVVTSVEERSFVVQTWRAPLAPEDGSVARGETVLSDVDFAVMAMVFE